METKHYIERDHHNPSKGHHIRIEPDGRVFYNQALKYDEHPSPKIRDTYQKIYAREYESRGVPGYPEWLDFYDRFEEVTDQVGHGYQEHIDSAIEKWKAEKREEAIDRPRLLDIGDTFPSYFNQADREVEILATTETEALGVYEMPNGRSFLAIFERTCTGRYGSQKWKRSQAVKTLPKYWKEALDGADLAWIHQNVG